MFKKEWIYRELACAHLQERGAKQTGLALSRKFSISLSTVHHAMLPLKQNGIVAPLARGFRLVSFPRLLAFWGSERRLAREILWQGSAAGVHEAEKLAPSGAIWGGCTAYKMRYKDVPADYSTLMLYADEKMLPDIMARMEAKGNVKLLVLKKDRFMKEYSDGGLCPDPQVYVDLWNTPEWYAADFRRALEKRMGFDEEGTA
ncbi:MAG: hypothetical protein NTX79_04495 [Candidatus Micrarchaeota archaeon]|nr:hypothetical protein [Candidatus Micrarchaeota archaeon]